MSFAFPLPTTGSVRFNRVLVDPSAKYTREIGRASAARSRLRASLKACRREKEVSNKDWASVLKAILDYLPHLYAIERAVGQDALLSNNMAFSWRPVLSVSLLKKSRRITIANVHFEVAFSLFTLALVFMNLASRSVAGLGDYEHQRNTSESERKRLDEQLNAAADMLCRAAGILDHIAQDLVPAWDNSLSPDSKEAVQRPIDLSPDILVALSSAALADAEGLALRRLLSKAASDTAISPGPPLPRSHPSPTLLAKLQLNIHSLLQIALQNVSQPRSSKFNFKKSDGSAQEVWPEWRRHLERLTVVAGARAYKWLGVEAGEGSNNDTGKAVAWLQIAQKELDDLSGSKLFAALSARKAGSSKSAQHGSKTLINSELAHIQAFFKVYKKMNDTVMFKPVPSASTLLDAVPGGRAALAKKRFEGPSPAFLASSDRPGDQAPSLSSLSLQDQEEDQAESDSDEDDSSSETEDPSQAGAGYALSERYY